MEGMIKVTGADPVELVKAAYDLSKPQGMGFMHYQEGSLTNEEAKSLVNENDDRLVVSLDYVKGRSCKFNVFKQGNDLFIREDWYDHSPTQLNTLLERVGVERNG